MQATPAGPAEAEANRLEILDETISNLVDAYGMDVVRDSLRRCRKSRGNGRVRLNSEGSLGSSCSSDGDENSRAYARKMLQRSRDMLRRSQRLMQACLDASFDPIFAINQSGVIIMVNQAAEKQFQWSQEELMGQNISVIAGGDHSKAHDSYMQRYLETGETGVMGKRRVLPAKRKDGTEFPIELGVTEIKTQEGEERLFCGFIRDLTSQKKFEHQLEMKQQIMSGIIEASSDAMFAISVEGIIEIVNTAACDQFLWTREELIGQNISVIMGTEYAEKHDGFLARYAETGIKTMIGSQREVLAYRKNRSTFPAVIGIEDVGHGDSRRFVAFIRDITDEKRFNQMEIEKKAAEALLLNMLPEQIASRLKEDPSHIADQHNVATVAFADIVGFTQMSSTMSPVELVKILNDLFSRFDELVEKYALNKVKTIGDCYMVASVPGHSDESEQKSGCSRVCHFAIEMIDALHAFNCDNPGRNLDLRVGINAGPVVGGVVGTKRFLYDLWGDSVNLASRMESTGVPGRIQVSTNIVDLVGDEFEFESRGKIPVKGKGDVETFFLEKQLKECRLPRASMRRRAEQMTLYTTLAAISQRDLLSTSFRGSQSRDIMAGFGRLESFSEHMNESEE